MEPTTDQELWTHLGLDSSLSRAEGRKKAEDRAQYERKFRDSLSSDYREYICRVRDILFGERLGHVLRAALKKNGNVQVGLA